jgi:phosphatidylglycerol:prolipoprotein diacylglycerol transferase
MYPITFPNLGLQFNINPIAFTLSGRNIYWYGIIIAVAIIISMFLAKRDDGRHNIKWDDVQDFLIVAIIVGIICARIYYVVFKWSYYSIHPEEIIMIWNRWNCNIWRNNWSYNYCNHFLQI